MLIGPGNRYNSPSWRAPVLYKNGYMVFALGKETAIEAVIGFIAWAVRRLIKPRSRKMRACSYAIQTVYPDFHFPTFPTPDGKFRFRLWFIYETRADFERRRRRLTACGGGQRPLAREAGK